MNSAPLPFKPHIQVMERMFRLFEILSAHEGVMSLKEISEKAQLHPSTTHRILNDLVMGRFVERTGSGTYRLGMRLLELGNKVKARLNIRDIAWPVMNELYHQIQQSVNLSIRQHDELVYIERVYNEHFGMQVVRAIGGRALLHLTSVGKLFLAFDAPEAVVHYARRTGLQKQTLNSLHHLPLLEQELRFIRQSHLAKDNEELEMGVKCIGAPIYNDQGEMIAGLSISAPADRLNEKWVEQLKTSSLKISKLMGYKGKSPCL